MKTSARRTMAAAAGLAGLLGMAGCLSDNPGSASLAYVDIPAAEEEAVRTEVIRVFGDAGYKLRAPVDTLVFEREATWREKLYFGHYSDVRPAMRVVVTIEPRYRGGQLVRADAYALHDGMKEPLMRLAAGPYQDQLNRVRANLVKSGLAESR